MSLSVPTPTDCTVILGGVYGDHPRHRFDLAVPSRPKGALVVYAANGWSDSARQEARVLMLTLAEQGWSCAIADLRGPNQTRDPADLVRDLRAVANKALEESLAAGADDHGLVLMGSGGAALVALAAAHAWPAPGKDSRQPRLRALVTMGLPATVAPEHLAGTALTGVKFLGALGDPLTMDTTHVPPWLLLHGDQDHDVPLRHVKTLHERLSSTDHPTLLHVATGCGPKIGDSLSTKPGHDSLLALTAFLGEYAVERPAVPLFAGRIIASE